MAKKWDVFISHAREDKTAVAMPLKAALVQQGLRVWVDEHELTVGDALIEKINDGLKNSRFGVVILSKTFFEKFWTNTELQGFMAKQHA